MIHYRTTEIDGLDFCRLLTTCRSGAQPYQLHIDVRLFFCSEVHSVELEPDNGGGTVLNFLCSPSA